MNEYVSCMMTKSMIPLMTLYIKNTYNKMEEDDTKNVEVSG